MANYCFTTYRVVGKSETLQQIKDAINLEPQSDTFNMERIMNRLGIPTESPIGLGGDWMNAEIKMINGVEVLCFDEEYRYNASCNMELIAEMPPFKDAITGVYRQSEEPGCGIFETTDTEHRFFPQDDEYGPALGIPAAVLHQMVDDAIKNGDIKINI